MVENLIFKQVRDSFDENASDNDGHADPLEPPDSLSEDGHGEDGAPDHGSDSQHLEQPGILQEGQSHVVQRGRENVQEGSLVFFLLLSRLQELSRLNIKFEDFF